MIDADKPLFLAALNELALIKPGANLSEDAYVAWWNAMHERWTLEEFRHACARLRDTCEFMPNPYHFEQLRKAALPTAGEAWNRAREIAKSLTHHRGFPQEATTDDAVLDAAVRAVGGYAALAMSTTENLHFLERRFVEHFEQIRDAETTRHAVPQIAGPRHSLRGPQSIGQLLGRPQ